MAVDSSPSIAPWNHERRAIFFIPPVDSFPTLGPLALVTAGFDAQTPATIQYAHQPARSHGNPLPREPLPRFPECAFRLTSGFHHARQARDHGLCSFAKGLCSLARNSSKGFFH